MANNRIKQLRALRKKYKSTYWMARAVHQKAYRNVMGIMAGMLGRK